MDKDNTITSFLQSNLLALSSFNSKLAGILSYTEGSDDVIIEKSRTGKIIPLIVKDGRKIPLHSRFDPEKEGERFYETFSDHLHGFVIVLGFGGAYHIKPLLRSGNISELLIIDKDIRTFRKIVEHFNLTGIFLDRRIRILIDPAENELTDHILENYIPAVSGNLEILKLRSRVETEPDFFSNILSTINGVITPLSEDFSVQSYFGKRWFINTVHNLKKAEKTTTVLPPVNKALVVGAGPSLEKQLDALKEHSKDGFIITTDTAFPSLMKRGIKPDLIISIDCQHITYHHFIGGIPDDVPLVLDLASPQMITRLTDNILFFTSGHPFSLYVKDRWREFPFIDTSGGNVSHAAVSLADSLGAKHILLFGVDFSYPNGKSYARGTYLYPYFNTRAFRTAPVETLFVNFILHNEQINLVRDSRSFRYVTKPMISYKKRLENLIPELNADVTVIEGEGEPITVSRKPDEHTSDASSVKGILSAGSASISWEEFLEEYIEELSALPGPDGSLPEYLHSLTPDQLALCMTLFPAAAAIRRTSGENINGMDVLDRTIRWTVDTVKKVTGK